jgi:poly(beta-D-mannuronate) C5 epimerase
MPFRRAGLALVVALIAVNLITVVGAGRAPAATAPVTLGISIIPTSYPISDGVLFVAPTGKDSNPGTQDAPLRTGAAAVAKAVVGRMTTVVFRQGEYRERLGDVSAPVTLQPYPGERVWFKGSTEIPASQLVADGNAWRLDAR